MEATGPVPNMVLAPFKAKEKGIAPRLTTAADSGVGIIDIRGAAVEMNLKTEIESMFRCTDGPRQLPTLLLYDERGLQLFERVRHPLQSPHSSIIMLTCLR